MPSTQCCRHPLVFLSIVFTASALAIGTTLLGMAKYAPTSLCKVWPATNNVAATMVVFLLHLLVRQRVKATQAFERQIQRKPESKAQLETILNFISFVLAISTATMVQRILHYSKAA